MRRQLKRLFLLALSATLAFPPTAFSVGTCLSGDCTNGYGSTRVYVAEYTGNWSNSKFIAGRYSVVYYAFPNQHFDLVIDGEGFPLKGTVARGDPRIDKLREPTLYSGTFSKLYHPFDKRYLPRYAHGRYTDTSGVVYEGDFDFIPSRDSFPGFGGGYYIFQGVRIDEESDQVRPGLYISDLTTSDKTIGDDPSRFPVMFHRATPDYIIKLQDEFRKDIQDANAEESAKLTKERESRESWNSLFTAALGFVAVVGVLQVASRSSGGSSPITALGDTLSGKQTSQGAATSMAGELRERAKTDPILAKRIGKASDAELVTMMKRAGSTAVPSMTMAEYQQSKSQRPAEADRIATERRSAATQQQAAIRESTQVVSNSTNAAANAMVKRNKCVYEFTNLGHAYEEADARAQVQKYVKVPGTTGVNLVHDPYRVISSSVSCKKEDSNVNPEYKCVARTKLEVDVEGACGNSSGSSQGVSK